MNLTQPFTHTVGRPKSRFHMEIFPSLLTVVAEVSEMLTLLINREAQLLI